MMLFSIEALKSRKQALGVNTSTRSRPQRQLVNLAPGVAPVHGPEGISGGLLGFGGRF
jgi:hypothetical protein